MPILLLITGLFIPRIAAVLLYFFTGWFSVTFDSWVLPVLGFILLPYTLLWYMVVQNMYGGVWGFWQLLFMVIALMLDLSSYSTVRRTDRT